ncbi:MAG: conserved phage C-terminal domain-containing protein [Candidatus Zapsychrus exili]|nr:conserved phage C-terminal domain-containing protein [Candidatus Zapsychrus exili]
MTRGSKWIPLDKYLAQEFKSIKREFSMIEAMFSYQLDIDNSISGTISGYSKLWGWSRNKVRKFINGIGTDRGHVKDSKRTHEGHPIHLIDLSLNDKKDRSGTGRGQVGDTLHDTTTKPDPNPKEIYSRVVDYLNRKTNSEFKPTTKKTIELINARTKEGFSPDDFKVVIDFKCGQWLKDGEKQEYLRPLTLFSSKFEGYLNAAKRELIPTINQPKKETQEDIDREVEEAML